MKYEAPRQRSIDDIIKNLKSNNFENVVMALLDLTESCDDIEYLVNTLLSFIESDNFWIAKTAMNCLAGLFRIYSDDMTSWLELVMEKLLVIENKGGQLSAYAEEAIEDINIFISRK